MFQTLKQQIELYENAGMGDEYNNLVPTYNKQIALLQKHAQEHDAWIDKYNDLIKSNNENNIDVAFNDCLDPEILFASYDQVDLHSENSAPITKR